MIDRGRFAPTERGLPARRGDDAPNAMCELGAPSASVSLSVLTWAGAGVSPRGGDGVADDDLFGADQDVLDEQPHDALAVLDGRGGGGVAEAGQEAFQVRRRA